VFDGDALMPEAPLLAAAPLPIDPVEDDDPVGEDDVGTLSGSELTPVPPLAVWSLAVWAWAVVMAAVMPNTVMAIKRRYRAFLLHSSPPLRCKTTREPPKRKMKFRKGAARELRFCFAILQEVQLRIRTADPLGVNEML
jgi:hypothetical protein